MSGHGALGPGRAGVAGGVEGVLLWAAMGGCRCVWCWRKALVVVVLGGCAGLIASPALVFWFRWVLSNRPGLQRRATGRRGASTRPGRGGRLGVHHRIFVDWPASGVFLRSVLRPDRTRPTRPVSWMRCGTLIFYPHMCRPLRVLVVVIIKIGLLAVSRSSPLFLPPPIQMNWTIDIDSCLPRLVRGPLTLR